MKQDRPWFPFYAGDWTTNQKLRRAPHELKGIWIDVMCLMHESEEYGVLRWPLHEIATAVGASKQRLEDLAMRGILKGAHAGQVSEPLTFVPVHARKRGPEVALIQAQPGPLWFSSRMVEDEHKRVTKQGFPSPDHSPKPPSGDRDAEHHTPHQSPPLVSTNASPYPSPLMRAGETEDRGHKELKQPHTHPPDGLSTALPADRPALSLVAASTAPPPCPHEAIVDAFHRLLPTLPSVRAWTPTRRSHLASRWKFDPERRSIRWWEEIFGYIAGSPFLLGQLPGRNGARPFLMTLEWLVKSEENLVKVIEGNYHEDQA